MHARSPRRHLSRAGLLAALLVISVVAFRWLDAHAWPLVSFLRAPYGERLLDIAWWRFLLPINIGSGHYRWTTTGLVVTTLLDTVVTPHGTLYLLNALVTLVAFLASWYALRSLTFATTLALSLGFGTHVHWTYVNTGVVLYHLFLSYATLNLLCVYQLLRPDEAPHETGWRAGFAFTLTLLALCWETWIDYLVFLLVAVAYLGHLDARFGDHRRRGRLQYVATTATVVLAGYLTIKLPFASEHLSRGNEGELVITYLLESPRYVVLAIDDILSNLVTYVYLAVSSFLPPFLVSSNSLAWVGKDVILGLQHGYHPAFGEMTYWHHVFLWYLHAGIVFTLFVSILSWAATRSLTRPSELTVSVTLLGWLVLSGSATHAMIKFRPYLSVPLLTYKVTISILGLSLLLAYLLLVARRQLSSRASGGLMALAWILLISNAWTRPRRLSTLAGLWEGGSFPDPGANLWRLFGWLP